MKVILGPPPEKDFTFTGYRQIAPNENLLGGVVVAISVMAVIAGYFLFPCLPPITEVGLKLGFYIACLIAMTLPLIVIHEIIHLVTSPQGFKGKDTAIGIHLRKLTFYAYTKEPQSWRRSLLMLLSPLLVLTVLPFVFMVMANTISAWLWAMAFINLSISANDLVVAFLIFRCVPRTALDVQPQLNMIWFLD